MKQALERNVLDKMMDQEKEASEQSDAVRKEFEAQCNRELLQGKATKASTLGGSFPDDPLMPDLEDTNEVQNTGIFSSAYDDDDLDTYNSPYADQVIGAEADFNNMEPSTVVSHIPPTRVHSIHLKDQIIRDLRSTLQKKGHDKDDNARRATSVQDSEVWTLVDLPYGKKAIGTKWVYRNKKDEVVRNKARLVAQGYKQEEGIDYDEVFAPVARIEAIRLFFAYASFIMFVCVIKWNVKSVFLYGTIEEEVYVSQPSSFVDPEFPDKVYKVEKALYGLHQAPKAWYETLSTYLLDNGFYRDNAQKVLDKFKESSLSSWVYKSSRKRMGSSLVRITYYAGASLDWKSTTGGCQFLSLRLISWQYKKQTIVANSTTKAEYIAASHCCGHDAMDVQNQMYDY
ncbi:putative ribonuclease H-like domain-containing protein [Tanacetum coccineum]